MIQVLLLHQLAPISLSCEHGNHTGIQLACELRLQECSDQEMASPPPARSGWMQHLGLARALTSDAEGSPASSKGRGFVGGVFNKWMTEHICQIWRQKTFLNEPGTGYNTKMICLGPLQGEVPTENTRQMFQF